MKVIQVDGDASLSLMSGPDGEIKPVFSGGSGKTRISQPVDDGYGLTTFTADGRSMFSTYKVLSIGDSAKKVTKIGLSLCAGCSIGCRYCFTRQYKGFRPLTVQEILDQVEAIGEEFPNALTGKYLKFSFKQMGDPLLNQDNTVRAIRELYKKYPRAMFVVSTSGMSGHHTLFSDLQALQDAGCNIRLQFSLHTTRDEERESLSPRVKMMTIGQIGEIVKNWHGSPVTLNMVMMTGFTYSVSALQAVFPVAKVFVKLNYLDVNEFTRMEKLADASRGEVARFAARLKTAGFQFDYRHDFPK